MPFLCRIMAEAPHVRINFGLVLLSLHKPLDVAEQIATADVLSGGKVIFGAALGYRDIGFLAFGTTQKELNEPHRPYGAGGHRDRRARRLRGHARGLPESVANRATRGAWPCQPAPRRHAQL
jgi:alkanesulfonate monooxygenase SsuD/methylene tetrahydromethanopterin reductase-like flavin-dependent oxidoreductase (luciferase family)